MVACSGGSTERGGRRRSAPARWCSGGHGWRWMGLGAPLGRGEAVPEVGWSRGRMEEGSPRGGRGGGAMGATTSLPASSWGLGMLCRERGGGRDEDTSKEGARAQGRWRRGARHGTPRRVVAVAGGGKSGDRVAREQRLRRAVASVAEPPKLSRLKCAGHHHKGNISSNALQTE